MTEGEKEATYSTSNMIQGEWQSMQRKKMGRMDV